ncbi:MAG: type II toxin-antitoxin system HicA family toxin [Reyranella sp.]|uniref:type II toxin-antitoxin system HicA family toxin n=1 Tax=Reyranella sp. TaxID=1929291 RepID=UPI003D0F8BE9
MKLPRDLSGSDLVKALGRLGYDIVRQTGSHMRLTRRIGAASHHHPGLRSAEARDTRRNPG